MHRKITFPKSRISMRCPIAHAHNVLQQRRGARIMASFCARSTYRGALKGNCIAIISSVESLCKHQRRAVYLIENSEKANILQNIHRSCVSYPSISCVSIDRKSIPSTQNGPVQDTEAGLHDEGATRLQARHQKSKRSKILSLFMFACMWR